EGIDRLHVVMAVEEHVRRARRPVMMRDDHRMTDRIARARVEADRLQVLDQPFGGPAAILGECGVGRDRWNPYQGEQALEAGVEIGVDTLEDFFNSGHWAA